MDGRGRIYGAPTPHVSHTLMKESMATKPETTSTEGRRQDVDGPAYPIESVAKALTLLLMFRNQRSVRAADAARELGVARSTAHRLLAMLQHYGLAHQDEVSRAYGPGKALVEIGLSAVRALDVRGFARPYLEALRDEVNETAHLMVLEGGDIVIVETIEADRTVRASTRVGFTSPAHLNASGKALLADLPSETFRRLYPREKLEGGTERAIRTRSELEQALEEIKQKGFATAFGEIEDDLSGVSAVVRDEHGHTRGAVTISAPVNRMSAKQTAIIARAVKRTAEQVGERLP